MTASPQAIAAVRAIKHAREWGAYATGRYLDRHNALDHYVAAVRFETKRFAVIWEATLKPLAVAPTAGSVATIRVQADSKKKAITEVRFHADFERCGDYAITKIEQVTA